MPLIRAAGLEDKHTGVHEDADDHADGAEQGQDDGQPDAVNAVLRDGGRLGLSQGSVPRVRR